MFRLHLNKYEQFSPTLCNFHQLQGIVAAAAAAAAAATAVA